MKSILLSSLFISLLTVFAEAKDLGFRYKNGSCINMAEQKGLNPGYIGQCGDLRHVVLSRFNLDEVDLSGTTFEGSDLQGTSLQAAILTDVIFKDSNLSGVTLGNTILKNNDFSGAILINAHFSGTQFENINFSSANMTGVVLTFANLINTRFVGATLVDAQFDFADLSNSDFTEARATGANFSSANLAGSTITKADFSSSNFLRANLTGISGGFAKFLRANLRHVNLSNSTLPDVVFISAQMENANLSYARLLRANLRSATFTNSDIRDTDFAGAVFNQKTTMPFTFDDAKALGMIFSPLSLFILWDDNNSDVDALKNFLEDQGIEVTKSAGPASVFDGSEKLDNYSSVLHLAGANAIYRIDMPTSGQQALVNFVNDGGTYVGTQWIGFMLRNGLLLTMKDLILLNYEGGNVAKKSYTPIQDKLNHPVLSGINDTIVIDSGVADSKLIPFDTNPSESLMKIDSYVGVAARSLGHGHVVGFAFAGSYSDGNLEPHVLLQEPVQKLILNSISWE